MAMQMVIRGKNLEVPEPLRDYVQKKLGKLDRYLDNITSVTVELAREKTKSSQDRHVAQVTLLANGTILRGEEKADELHTAIDSVANVMHRQIVRYKEKLYSRGRTSAGKPLPIEGEEGAPLEAVNEPSRRIVKMKQFSIKPMTVEEAVDQMELLGHDFFVFFNAATEQVNVLYRRDDGDYGLIEPEAA